MRLNGLLQRDSFGIEHGVTNSCLGFTYRNSLRGTLWALAKISSRDYSFQVKIISPSSSVQQLQTGEGAYTTGAVGIIGRGLASILTSLQSHIIRRFRGSALLSI